MLSDRYVQPGRRRQSNVALRIGELADSSLIARRAGSTPTRCGRFAKLSCRARQRQKISPTLNAHDRRPLRWRRASTGALPAAERIELPARLRPPTAWIARSTMSCAGRWPRHGCWPIRPLTAVADGRLRVVLGDCERPLLADPVRLSDLAAALEQGARVSSIWRWRRGSGSFESMNQLLSWPPLQAGHPVTTDAKLAWLCNIRCGVLDLARSKASESDAVLRTAMPGDDSKERASPCLTFRAVADHRRATGGNRKRLLRGSTCHRRR